MTTLLKKSLASCVLVICGAALAGCNVDYTSYQPQPTMYAAPVAPPPPAPSTVYYGPPAPPAPPQMSVAPVAPPVPPPPSSVSYGPPGT